MLPPPPLLVPPPPHPTPATTTITRRTASGANAQRLCFGTHSINRKQTIDIAPYAKGQLRPEGPLLGNRYRALVTAVEAMFRVAVPVVAVLLNVIMFGAEKFVPGVEKLQVGRSTAPAGEPVTAQLSVTVTELVIPVPPKVMS